MEVLGYGSDSQVVRTGVTVLPGGNVGIGTTNPIAKLHIMNGNQTVNGVLLLQNPTNSATNYGFDIIATNTPEGWANLGKIGFYRTINEANYDSYMSLFTSVNGSLNERMRITSYGNVGIGTTNPNEVLSIAGSVNAGIGIYSSASKYIQFASVLGNGFYSASAVIGDGVIRTMGGANLMLQTGSGAAAIYINTSNNVGIGTTNPISALHVNNGLINSSNGRMIINSTTTNVYTIISGTSGFIVIVSDYNAKYMGYFEWTTGVTTATLTQIMALNSASTLTVSLSGNTIQATSSVTSAGVTVRTILF
jgi:hypothetical protein